MHPTLDTRAVRRLALAKAGLLRPEWTGLPARPGRGERRRRDAALAVVRRFGYLQLDTVSVAGARSHVLVLLSRFPGFPPALGERLLEPGEPLFEYWGHQASWMPLSLYPLFGFRRRGIRRSDWWARAMEGRRPLARELLRRIRDDGPLRSADLEGKHGGGGWWDHKPAKHVAVALWSSGELAVRERANFQRTFDLPERVVPDGLRRERISRPHAVRELLALALDGHGWATIGTLAATWSFRNLRPVLTRALAELEAEGRAVPCAFRDRDGKTTTGWIRPEDLDLADRLRGLRLPADRGVLLSPFDPVLWDRNRVARLFGFDQILEIFKPARLRRYGYFCLPVLAGERLVARVDLKADRRAGRVTVLLERFESTGTAEPGSPTEAEALRTALLRFSGALELTLDRPGPG